MWLLSPKAWLQIAVIGFAPLLIWEGDFHDQGAWTFPLSWFAQVLVSTLADFTAAAAFALVLRWLLHEELRLAPSICWCLTPIYWLEKFLGLWLWHPLAHLSYAGYMLTPICAEMSFRALGGVAAVVPGYGYFSKIYFATLGLNLTGALFLNVLLETPIMKVVRYQ